MKLRIQRRELPLTACKHSELWLSAAYLRPVIRYKGQGKQRLIERSQCIVALSRYHVEAQNLTSAGAEIRQNASVIPGSIADERHGLHPDRGDDKLPNFTRRQGTACIVYDFGDDMVFPQVHPFMGRTADCPAQRHFPRTVVGEEAASEQRLTLPYYSARTGVSTHERALEASAPAHTQDAQKLYRHTHKGIGLFARHDGGVLPVSKPRAEL